MSGAVLPWILAALAAAAAVLSLVKLRAVRASLLESEDETASLRDELRAAKKRSGSRSSGERRHSDEVAELRRKLEKAKKRATQAREEQVTESHRIKELEERLRLRDADMRAARAGTIREPAVAPTPKPAPRPVEKPAPVAAPVVTPPKAPEVIESEALAAAGKRVELAEAARDASQAKLVELGIQVKRLQGKSKTQDKLYASIRLELEAKKDRLGAQQEELERLRAMRVALMEPAEVASQPEGEPPALSVVPGE